MEFFEAVKKRRSIRNYKDKEVPNELIEKIIDAAQWAPSGMNTQPWQFVVIKDKETLKQLNALYKKAREKLKIYPQDTSFVERITVILVCFDGKSAYAKNDCYLAIENILLAATALGLGSLCMGALNVEQEEIKKLCKIPNNIELVMPIAIGYADEAPEPKPRKELNERVHYETY